MKRIVVAGIVVSLLTAGATSLIAGPGRPDPAALTKAQREAMARFAVMDGVWRGEAWTMTRTGEKHRLIQTERVGSFLDGAVKVIEGRGYESDGSVGFNALGVISFDVDSNTYKMRSYAQGHAGDFTITPNDDGFTWEIPAGPMKIIYTITIKNGTWTEVGDRIMPGKKPIRIYEVTMKRIEDTTWPAAGAVSAK